MRTQRKYLRAYKRMPAMFIDQKKEMDKAVYAEIVNISSKGACIQTSKLIEVSSEVPLGLFVPGVAKEAGNIFFINCKAVVVSSSSVDRTSLSTDYYLGLQFIELKEEDLKRINQFIKNVLSEGNNRKYLEKRTKIRKNIKLQAIILMADMDLQGVEYGELKNISTNGGYLISNKAITLFNNIYLRIFIPHRSTTPLGEQKDTGDKLVLCKGKVVRIESRSIDDESIPEFGVGVEFTEMDKNNKATLKEFISFIKKENIINIENSKKSEAMNFS